MKNYQDKPKEQLIKELEELQQRYDSLKAISDADINRLKQEEEKLSKLERRNRAWLENSPVCTKIVDLDFNLQYMSSAGIKGLQMDDITAYYGKPYPFHFYPESFKTGMKGNMIRAKETGKVITQEAPVVDVNGHEVWYHSTIVPVKDTNNRVDYLMIVSLDTTERRLNGEAQKQSEELFKAIFENSLNPIMIADDAGNYLRVNEAAAKMFHYPVEKMLQMNVGDIQTIGSPDAAKRYQEYLAKGYEIGEFDFVRPDNSVAIAQYHAVRVRENFNLSILSNITEHKLAEEKLKESEAKYRQLYEFNQMPIAIFDVDTLNFLSVNNAWINKYGYTKEELLSMTILEIRPESEQERVKQSVKQICDGLENVGEYLHKKKNGEIIKVEIIRYDLVFEGKNAKLVFANDITVRKLAETALAQSRSELKAIYDLSPVMMCLVDANRQVIFANQAFTNFTGTHEEQLKGGHACGVFGCINALDDSRGCGFGANCRNCNLRLAMDDTLKNGTVHTNVEYHTTLLRNGETREVVLLGSTALIESNDQRKLLLCLNDITARKQAEEALRKSETNYRRLFETLSEGVALNEIIYNDQGEMVDYRILEVNPAFYITARYDGPVIGRLATDLYQMPAEFITAFWREHKERQAVQFTEMISPVNGRYVLVATSPFIDGRFVTSFIDITERKQAEAELIKAKEKAEESEEKYRLLFENANEAIYIVQNEKLVFTNPACEQISGISKDNLTGFAISDFVDENDKENLLKHHNELINGITQNQNSIFTIINQKGEKRHISVNSVLINWNGLPATLNFGTDITERKLAEENLIESQRKLSTLMGNLPGLAFRCMNNQDWTMMFMSEGCFELTGFYPHELEGNKSYSYANLIHKDDVDKVWQDVQDAINKKTSWQTEYRIHTKKGIEKWVWEQGCGIYNKAGNLEFIEGFVTDITERKLSEAIFKDIVEKNPMSIQILDMDGYPIQVNSAHTKLFGVKIPADYSVLKDPQLLSLGFDEFFGRIKKGEVVYFPDTFYNVHDVDPSFPDNPVWVKTVGFTLNDNNGKPEKIVLIHENITERKNAEALLNDIIENNPMSIQIVDKEGYTLRENPAFIQLFGAFPPPEFSIFEELKSKSPELENLISKVKDGAIVNLPDIYFNAHDIVAEAPDIPLWIRALIFPLKNSSGKPGRFVFMHENITKSKIAEKELIKAKEKAEESDRLKSAFLANMSHEIRTPMNGILGFAELLKEPDLTGAELQKYIGIIEKSGNRMLNIINDIIDISKIEAGLMKLDIKESNINEQIEYIYTFFKPEVEAKGMRLSFRNTLPVKEATINTDREKFYAILTNLVKNAIKYTPSGSIEFGYEIVETLHATSLQFYVKDTGIGIPKDRQEAIFERFVQADIEDKKAQQGAGLGLAITKSYIEMLGGKIWVESDPDSHREGVGSCFYFTLPYNPKPEENASCNNAVSDFDADNHLNSANPRLKILIAEDDESSEMLISIMVKMFGKEIIKVRTGIDAIEACRNNPDLDLILMDIRMPEMGGYEATRQIRHFNKNVFIIAQTAYGLTGDREKALEAGCNEYISKPINSNLLKTIIQSHFDKRKK